MKVVFKDRRIILLPENELEVSHIRHALGLKKEDEKAEVALKKTSKIIPDFISYNGMCIEIKNFELE